MQYHRARGNGALGDGRRRGSCAGSDRRWAPLEVVDVMDRIRELTGIYGLGFRKESVLGLVLPIAFVVLVGGAIAVIILTRL